MKGIKATMTHDLFSIPSSGNCEADDSQFLDLILNWQSDDPIATTSDSDSEEAVVDSMPLTEMNILLYLVGWTCQKFLKDHDCPVCRRNLLDVNCKLDSSNKLFCSF